MWVWLHTPLHVKWIVWILCSKACGSTSSKSGTEDSMKLIHTASGNVVVSVKRLLRKLKCHGETKTKWAEAHAATTWKEVAGRPEKSSKAAGLHVPCPSHCDKAQLPGPPVPTATLPTWWQTRGQEEGSWPLHNALRLIRQHVLTAEKRNDFTLIFTFNNWNILKSNT